MSESTVRNPSQGRAIRTRKRLVEAAEADFAERGYAATTARSIAERAGVATGTFYQYFADKEVMLRELAQVRQAAVMGRAVEALRTDQDSPRDEQLESTDNEFIREAAERMRLVVELVMDYHRENPRLHAVLTERRHADAKLDELTSAGEEALVHRIATLLERWGTSGSDDHLATAFVLFGMVEGSVHAHVLGQAMMSNERFVETLVRSMLRVALPHLSTPA